MTKKQWAIALALSALAVAVILGLSYWQLGNELDKSRSESKAAHNDADQANARALGFSNDWAQATGQVAALEKEKEAVANAQKSMEDQMKSALQSKDVTISQLQGKLTVNILDRILFDSGEASMKSEGEKVLRQIATVLSQFPRRQVHVVGHTDNIPIRAAARVRFPSNWELSTARATSAVRFLSEQAGVDPGRLAAEGYGEFHPVADNSTEEGRARNRRIELVVMPEELSSFLPSPSGITNAPPPKLSAPTNSVAIPTNASATNISPANPPAPRP